MVNQYSYILMGFIVLAILTYMSWRFVSIKYAVFVAVLTFVLLVAVQLLLSTNTNTSSNVEAFDAALASETPVLLLLYSDF